MFDVRHIYLYHPLFPSLLCQSSARQRSLCGGTESDSQRERGKREEREERERREEKRSMHFSLLCTTKAYWLNSFQASPPTMLLTCGSRNPFSFFIFFCSVNFYRGQQPHVGYSGGGGGREGGGEWMDGWMLRWWWWLQKKGRRKRRKRKKGVLSLMSVAINI